MFLTEKKISQRINELSEFRYRERKNIESWQCIEDASCHIGSYPPESASGDEMQIGDRWKGRDRYLWLTADIEVPAAWEHKKVVGRFDFGNTGGGNNSGFESLLFFDGKPYQGVDSNHTEVFFPEGSAGTSHSLSFRLWSGLEGGGEPRLQEHEIKRSELAWLDETADDFYFTSRAALDTVKCLDPSHPPRVSLLQALNHAINRIDWSRPGSTVFYDSVYDANAFLQNELDQMEKNHAVTVHCVGHTHIDVAWLWQLKHTREKSARSFSTVLRLMEMFPEYIFLQTQPQLYEYIKADYPEIYSSLVERVREGRWEAGGGMWLEADCNLPSGESLVRQLLFGTRFLRNEFGVECRYLWLPDVFGYSWALPQILKKSGIETFMTTKISWNQYNRMPHDTFQWRGIDGSEVLTHFITTPEPRSAPDSWFYTYNGQITAETVSGSWESYQDKDINSDLLLSYGYGDGGGGVNREMLEMRRRLDRIPGLPEVKTGSADSFFHQLQETIRTTEEYVHTWDGELYLEYHRGTYTSQAYNKRMNRKLELLYRQTEWISVFSSIMHDNWAQYPQSELNEGWKIILRNQFHDIIPGSSIREVYEDSKVEYDEAKAIAEKVSETACQSMLTLVPERGKAARDQSAFGGQTTEDSENEVSYVVLHSAPWQRTETVKIAKTEELSKGEWYDAEGNRLMSQSGADHWLVQVEAPSMGFTSLRFESKQLTGVTERERVHAYFNVNGNSIESPHYVIQWNKQGQLVKLYDKDHDREVLADGMRGNVLQVFEDKPLAHEAWDIDLFYQEKMKEISELSEMQVLETGPLRAVIQKVWKYMDSTIRQKMVLYTHSRRIDFLTEVDWQEPKQLLKVAFPVQVRSTSATYDIQFGNVQRPTHWNTSWDWAQFESVGHQWADLSERGYGVSLLNDCKYGYDIKDNVLRLTLIKSATHPDVKADQGYHAFTYALMPHGGDWLEGRTVEEAWSLNNPLTAFRGQVAEASMSLFKSSADNIMFDAVKKAEDHNKVLLRIHEFAGSRNPVTITSDLCIEAWQECDLMERFIGEKQEKPQLHFSIAPYEIKTFLIDISPNIRSGRGKDESIE